MSNENKMIDNAIKKLTYKFEKEVTEDIIEKIKLKHIKQLSIEHQDYNKLQKNIFEKVKEYKKNIQVRERKEQVVFNKKAIEILDKDIKDLRKVFENKRLFKYFTKRKLIHPNGATEIKDGGNPKNAIANMGVEIDEYQGDVFLILQDLCKLRRIVKGLKNGTKNVKVIMENIQLNKIDEDYISELYFTPKMNLEKEIIQIINESYLYKSDDNIIEKIKTYFKSHTYAKHYNSISQMN